MTSLLIFQINENTRAVVGMTQNAKFHN